jgi:hypothetical protein
MEENQRKILGVKNAICKTKSVLEYFSSRIDEREEIIIDPKDKIFKNTKLK